AVEEGRAVWREQIPAPECKNDEKDQAAHCQNPESQKPEARKEYTTDRSILVSGFRLLLFGGRRGGAEREGLIGGLGWPESQAKRATEGLRKQRKHVLFSEALIPLPPSPPPHPHPPPPSP